MCVCGYQGKPTEAATLTMAKGLTLRPKHININNVPPLPTPTPVDYRSVSQVSVSHRLYLCAYFGRGKEMCACMCVRERERGGGGA